MHLNKHPLKDNQQDSDRYWAIIPAAGVGRRMGTAVAKQYLRIDHRTILELSIERLHALQALSGIVLALNAEDSSWKFLATSHYNNISTVTGGAERCHSVLNALKHLQGRAANEDWVLVHDAVRPCVALSDMEKLVEALRQHPVGGLLASRVKETVKRAGPGDVVEATVDRSALWLAATPQMFRFGVLLEAMQTAIANNLSVTDEASAVEAMGLSVKLVEGRADNIKITHPEDLQLVELLLKQQARDAVR